MEESNLTLRQAAAFLLMQAILDNSAISVVDVNHRADAGGRRIGSVIVLNGDLVSRTFVELIQSVITAALETPEEVTH